MFLLHSINVTDCSLLVPDTRVFPQTGPGIPVSKCHDNEHQCQSTNGTRLNHCIPESWLCDGDADCPNGTDELECGKYMCTKGKVQVHNKSAIGLR